MGVAPWQRWTDTPTPFMREYFFRAARIAEQAEMAAMREKEDPNAKLLRFAQERRFIGQRPN